MKFEQLNVFLKKIVIIDWRAFFGYKFYDQLIFILTLAFLHNILIHVFSYVTLKGVKEILH